MINKHICFCCGKHYHYCPHCEDFDGSPTWMNTFESERCHKAFTVLTDYHADRISLEQAYEALKDYDWSDLASWSNRDNADDLTDLFSEYAEKKKAEKAKQETVEQEKPESVQPKQSFRRKTVFTK